MIYLAVNVREPVTKEECLGLLSL